MVKVRVRGWAINPFVLGFSTPKNSSLFLLLDSWRYLESVFSW